MKRTKIKTEPLFVGRKSKYIVKIISLSKQVYSFNTISLNNPAGFSVKINKIIQNSCLNTKGLK